MAVSFVEQTDEQSEKVPKEDKDWVLVAGKVSESGATGMLWSDVAEEFTRIGRGPQSKSAVSGLLSAMRSAGWIEAVAEGRRKRLFAGPRMPRAVAFNAERTTEVALQPTESPVPATQSQPVAFTQAASRTLDIARAVVSFNQGKLIEFDHLAGLKHRAIRDVLPVKGGAATSTCSRCSQA
jgi:hypothetical protein